MLNTVQLTAIYGNPNLDRATFEKKWMILWDIPQDINNVIKVIPNKIYCNKVIVPSLEKVLRTLISKGLHTEIKTWDGCFNIRTQRNSTAISRHSWAIAIDMNAAWNPLITIKDPTKYDAIRLAKMTWTEPFLQVWRDNNWVCGADWKTRLDGMHFEFTNT